MHALDEAAWRDITFGRQVTWADWFGTVEGIEYLTDAGLGVRASMIEDLTEFLGPDWLHRARAVAANGQPALGFADRPPCLIITEPVREHQAAAYADMVRWWAALALCVAREVPGLARVRSDIRNDVRLDRVGHVRRQLMLAALGFSRGASVALEPDTWNGAGDLVWETAGQRIVFEVRTLTPDANFNMENHAYEEHLAELRALVKGRAVYFAGDVPGRLPAAEKQRWLDQVAAAIEEAGAGVAQTVPGPRAGALHVCPGVAPPGTELVSAAIEADQGRRLRHAVSQKISQTRAIPDAWIWIEELGALAPFTEFVYAEFHAQLDAVDDAFSRQMLDDGKTSGGAILALAGQRTQPLPPDQHLVRDASTAHRIGLQPDRVSRTFVVPGRLLISAQASFINRALANEGEWLDFALRQLGINGGLKSLITV